MATREAAPKTWPSGEKAAERIKEEREKQQQNAGDEDKIIDNLQWKQNVTDLHKVMEVAKSLWLIHEHSNEAMIRTALEIAMDQRCKKVLWWPDFWFSDHDKREHFKEIVRVKLAVALANATGAAVDLSDFDKEDEVDSELVQNLRRQIAELEAALRAARAAQAAAEARCRELEEIADEAKKRAAALEKAMDTLRKEARSEAKETVASTGDSGVEDEIQRLKQQLAQSEEKNQKLEEIIKELRKQLKQGSSEDTVATSDSTNNSDLAAAQRRIEELEKQIKALRKEIAELKKGKPQVVKEKTGKKSPSDDGELDDLQKQLDAERKRREELEEELRKMQEKLALMQKELELEKKKAADLQAQMKALLDGQKGYTPQAAHEAPPPQQVIEVGGMTAEQLAELEELRAKAAQVDKLLAKLKKRDQQIASLQEENERLNEEQMKLLKMLKQVREQLRIVMELAEKKGLGDLIKKLFEEAGLADTMADPEYTCFDRLYDDALRRMDKQRRLEWFRLGNTGEPPAWFKGKNPYRRRGDSSPLRTGAGAGSGTSELEHSSSGGTSLYCRNCGFPVREAPWRGDSPEPHGAARAESLESRSPAPNPYRSNAPTYVELEREGRDHSRQRSQSQGSRVGGQKMRSQSPPTAHALDMRIDVIKPGGEGSMAYAVANFSVEESHGWDAPAGVPAQAMKRPSPMQPDMARMGRSGPNFHRGPAQLHHQQLDPLQGGGPKARSRSPPVDRSLGQRTMNSQQRTSRSTSDLRGNLPRLAAAESPPMRQSPPLRMLAGSSSATELRGGPSYGEGPLPIPGGGHARMRGVMLVEHPRAPAGEEGPRLMWRPHKNSPDLQRSAAGGWGPGLS